MFILGCGGSSEPPPVYLGHVADRSGPDARGGPMAELGIRLALLDGDPVRIEDHPVAVRHTDTRGEPAAYEAEAVRLVALQRVPALLGGTTPEEVERLQRAGVPVLAFLGRPRTGPFDRAFFLGVAPARRGQVLAEAARKEPNAADLRLFVAEGNEEAPAAATAFAGAWKELGGQALTPIVLGKDLATIVKNADLKPGAPIAFAGSGADFARFTHHLDGKTGTLWFLGPETDLPPSVSQPYLYAGSFSPAAAEEASKQFAAAFRKQFGKPADAHAALAYDGVRLLIDAIRRASAAGEGLGKELRATKDFPGVTGTLTIGPDQAVARRILVIRREGERDTVRKTD